MSDFKVAYAVTTWSGAMLEQTLASIPVGKRVLVVDSRQHQPLSQSWNHAIDTLLGEGYDAVVVTQDDVVLREDTGRDLAYGLLQDQYADDRQLWTHRELLLLSARHASPSDACTNAPDWKLLEAAEPAWQPGPDFACFCVGRKLFQVVGRFDEGFAPCWFEDNDMHRRIQLAGYEAGALAPYWHFRNGTIRSDPERRQAALNGGFEAAKRHYCQKWGAPFDAGSPLGRETFDTPFGRPVEVRV